MTSAERARALVDALLLIEPDDDGGSAEGLRVIAAAIDAAVAEALPRWVPVVERLPHVDEYVLVTYRHGLSGSLVVCEAAFRGRWDADDPPSWDSHGWPIQDIVAWQPLPAPWVAP